MTPPEELRAAAAKLRKAGQEAAAGPWSASPVYSPRSHVTSAVYSMAFPTGTADSEIVGSAPVGKGQGGIRNPYNAVWIALAHPGLAEPLAEWLESWDGIEFTEQGAMNDDLKYALRIARVINGSAP